MAQWRLNLLGDCELIGPSGQPIRLSTRKALALLAILATQRSGRSGREKLAGLLWERADAEAGRLHLRKALWSIRAECNKAEPNSAPPVETVGDQVVLSTAVAVDASQFLAAIHDRELTLACSLYRGDFLGDLNVRHAPSFDEWASGKRQDFRDRAIEALVQLAEKAEDRRPDEAMEAAQRLLALDPLEERGHRIVMRLHERQGRSGAALSHYRGLVELLQQELDVEPEAETRALQQRIAVGRSMRPTPRLDRAPTESRSSQAVAMPARRRRAYRLAALSAVALASTAGAVQWSRAAKPPAIDAIFPVVPGLDIVGRPNISSDGSRLAFTARGPGGAGDIYLFGIADHRLTRVTNSSADEDYAAWAPNGGSIAFVRAHTDGRRDIVVRTLAGGERQVALVSTELPSKLTWAPDGGSLFFADGGPSSLVRLRLADGRLKRLTNPPPESIGDRDPVVSADGKTIAFLRATTRATSALMLLDLATGQERALSRGNNLLSGVAFTEGGKGLLFSSDRGGDAGLWFVGLSGGEPTRISEGLLRYRGLSGSSAGGRFIFEGVRDRSGIFAASSQSTKEGDFREWSPDVASDGSLLFVSTRSGGPQLWVQFPGLPARQLTAFSKVHVLDPRWSADAGRIAFVGVKDGQADLYVMARTGKPVRLTHDAAEERSPAWSDDGRCLFFVSRRGGAPAIWRIAIGSTSKPQRVSGLGITDVRTGGDGWLYYTDGRRGGLFRRRLSAGQLPVGPEHHLLPFQPTSWDVAAGSLTYLDTGERPEIKRLDLGTGAVRSLGSAAGLNPTSAFAVRPNGSLLVNRRSVKVELYGIDLI